jgi:hypothetical protein
VPQPEGLNSSSALLRTDQKIVIRVLKVKYLFFLGSDHGAQGNCNFLLHAGTPRLSRMYMNLILDPYLVYVCIFSLHILI